VLKLAENPSILHPDVESLREFDGTWWVAHTKARAEKAFAWDLRRCGIAYFLPMQERVRISSGKKRHALLPLFSSYVFFCGDETDRYTAMTTNRLCQTIPVVDQETLVAQLSDIQRALRAEARLDPYPRHTVGRLCQITSGTLKGIRGVVIRRGRHARIVLQIDMLGQGAIMEIDADLLEPVD